MTRSHAIALCLLAAAASSACAKLESDKVPPATPSPSIATSGPHAVVVGGSISISATTSGGTDPGYTLASADVTIASVDGQGTGNRCGQRTDSANIAEAPRRRAFFARLPRRLSAAASTAHRPAR
jgi:hypothetical protein